jgi:hypothetical protein
MPTDRIAEYAFNVADWLADKIKGRLQDDLPFLTAIGQPTSVRIISQSTNHI